MTSVVISNARAHLRIGSPGPLRRLSLELSVIVALKIALLVLIWWLWFAPQPKPDTTPAAIAHLLSPTSPSPVKGQP
ncbi:MAG: hypothetical protein OQK79_03055 [Rhodanobacter sp.]|jgi:uncharacterized membrane protein|nr:hypothetical protein [Rhodanobacter sp.]